MTRPFVWYLAVWTVVVCSGNAAVTFHLENSWAYPEAASSSLILKDTRGEVDGTQVSSLTARTVNISVPPPTREALGDFRHSQQGSLRLIRRDTPAPDVGDRETLVNLAKASWDAYYPNPSPDGWYDIDGLNWTSRFGWRPGQDGLRGHLFMSVDKRHGIIVFKGTTLFQLGTSPNPDTIEGDRLNVSGGSGGTVIICSSPVAARTFGGGWRLVTLANAMQMVVNYFQHKYPHTSFWLVGHSLGGSVASLVGMRFHIPTVTFEAPGERLAALRLGLVASPDDAMSQDYITHIYNNLDPLSWGACKGPLSFCAQAGYAMESKCHAGQVAIYLFKGPKWTPPLVAHRLETVIAMLENEDVPVPSAIPQTDCEDCPSWKFGEYPVPARSWWRRLWDMIRASD